MCPQQSTPSHSAPPSDPGGIYRDPRKERDFAELPHSAQMVLLLGAILDQLEDLNQCLEEVRQDLPDMSGLESTLQLMERRSR